MPKQSKSGGWFLHFISRSVSQRMARTIVSVFATAIAASVIVASTGLSLGTRGMLGKELSSYGANVIASAGKGTIDENAASKISKTDGVESIQPQVYAPAYINGVYIEAVGVDFDALRKEDWTISEGSWPSDDGVLLGIDLKHALSLSIGQEIKIAVSNALETVRVSGFVQRGGDEDKTAYLTISKARELSNQKGVNALLIRAVPDRIDSAVASIKAMLPDAEVKTLRQVASAEEAFLKKIGLLMALVSIAVVIASCISLSSTMSATVLERIWEIGLMMAIGAERISIGKFFAAESIAVGVSGGALGYVLGYAASEVVSKAAFGSYINVPLYLLPISIAAGAIISVLSGIAPVINALRLKPAVILRGQ